MMKKTIQLLLLLITSIFLLSSCFSFNNNGNNNNDNPTEETEDENENENENEEEDENEDEDEGEREYIYLQSKILKINRTAGKIELLNYGVLNLNPDVKLVQYINNEIKPISLNNLYVGQENVFLQIDKEKNEIVTLLLDGDLFFKNIRVAIRKSIDNIADESTLYHDSVEFKLNNSYRIQIYDDNIINNILNPQIITIDLHNNEMVVKSGDEEILRSNKRIIITPISFTNTITFNSIKRSGNRKPSYYGSFEIAIENGRLLVINEVFIEDYLRFVVPSEMPSSFGLEALKAQAVAARTYAYGDILKRSYEYLGYAVDDSTMSQVYNNIDENSLASRAVSETRGFVMLYNNEPINAYYYSTSSGLIASGHEVWITEPTLPDPIPYLMGNNLTRDLKGNIIEFDPTSEESMLIFFKRLDIDVPDGNNYVRWKVTLTKNQVQKILNNTLVDMYFQYPNLILTKTNDQFISTPIPNDIGEVLDLVVSQRGQSGVVISLDVVTTKATYRIINQYNIRFTLRAHSSYAGESITYQFINFSKHTYGNPQTPPSSALLSGFFAIEKASDVFTLYGGGFGHGVGMSQYGASGLAQMGYSYQDILQAYYSNIELTPLNYIYTPTKSDISKFFEKVK